MGTKLGKINVITPNRLANLEKIFDSIST